eukprot:CAMPEP_0197913974 /NCGR_PEP_ID=MMETSP1439-20131203/77623_1 /TAXON_ID=66791 /ORGANISM="Gonyaulax spinifera, Strain CCMP409" /LENGTH=51 /DNA_ID=CAMNT_0043535865 /DNA_START=108 /DNA_END=260 /DNA_ORIENTATION=-
MASASACLRLALEARSLLLDRSSTIPSLGSPALTVPSRVTIAWTDTSALPA